MRKKMFLKILMVLAFAYAGLCLAVYFGQRKIIFIPTKGRPVDPKTLNIPAEEVWVKVNSEVKLHGWWIRSNPSPFTLLWCHGNAGNILNRAEEVRAFANAGFNVLIFDYRGYGQSTGAPSAEGLKQDVLAVFDHLTAMGVKSETIIPYGRSVGSGPACHLAVQRKTRGLVLVQAFTSTLEMGKQSFPFLPVKLLLREIFDNSQEVVRFKNPLLVIHGNRDNIVPYKMGKELHRISPSEKKSFITLKGGDHNSIGYTHQKEILTALKEFLELL